MIKAISKLKVYRALATHLGLDPRAIDDAQRIDHDLGLDRLDLALIAVRLEDSAPFRGELPFELLDEVVTVGELVAIVDTWLESEPVDDDRITLPGGFVPSDPSFACGRALDLEVESRESIA